MARMIAALFVETNGVYFGLPDVDPWDIERDARKYDGPWPVVAHPPCARYCRFAKQIQWRGGKRVGDDDGCFASALKNVRHYGGILEHPAESLAWKIFNLDRPAGSGWQRSLYENAWCCRMHQSAYGHRARKSTWLYFVGDKPPEPLDWSIGTPTMVISTSRRKTPNALPEMTDSFGERLITPVAFRNKLLELARYARCA